MTFVLFYEKSGCAGNRKQKALLEAAGHEVLARDLRDVCWAKERLLSFLGQLPVSQWFNRAAPAIKNGKVIPEALDEASALELLQQDPLLIRRPLMEANGGRMVGFDATAVDAWIGLGAARPSEGTDMEACVHSAASHGIPRCADTRLPSDLDSRLEPRNSHA